MASRRSGKSGALSQAQKQQERRCCARASILDEMREMVVVEMGPQTGLLLNLSALGAAVQAVYPTSPRASLNVKFRLPFTGDFIEATCEVAWVDDAFRTGLKFVHLADPTKCLLDAWLAAHSGGTRTLPEVPPPLSNVPSFSRFEQGADPDAKRPSPAAGIPGSVSTVAPDARTEAEKEMPAGARQQPRAETVRCEKCGQISAAENRYCGICGSPLKTASAPAAPAPAQPVRREEPRRHVPAREAVSVPSFLGLNAPGEERGSYLLDYEPPRRWRGVALVVILAVVGGLIWMQWHSTIKVQVAKISAMATQSIRPAPAPSPPERDASVTEPSPPAAETGPQQKSPREAAPAQPDARTGEKDSAEPDGAGPNTKSAPSRVRPAARPEDDSLLLLAQKYLHGRGVPENCEQGLIYLRALQQRSAKARSQLGALYATGHCVPQDRVEAYRWFTSALALDPHNVWLNRQRNILLAQMTSQERQRAR